MIIDTHQHLWDLDLFSYSWLSHFPSLNRSFRVKDYLEATEGLGIAKSVHVEADVDEAFMMQETRHILSLAEQNNPLEGVVACVRPEKPDFEASLERIVDHPKLKGVRRPLHTQPDPLGQSPIFIENVRRLEKYNLSFDSVPASHSSSIIVGSRRSTRKFSIPGVNTLRKYRAFPTWSAKCQGW